MTGDRHYILAYHSVGSDLPWPISTPEDVLEGHLNRFKGYHGLTLAQREKLLAAGELPDKSIVVTFDDGCRTAFTALRILKRHGIPGTIFPRLDFIESGDPLIWPQFPERPVSPLTWDQLSELAEQGWEIGSHTVSHPRLMTCDEGALKEELGVSRSVLARKFGACETIAYPHGNCDARVAVAAEQAGYLAGCTLSRFHVIDEPLRRPRLSLGELRGVPLSLELSRFKDVFRRSRAAASLSGTGRAELSRR
jgi:peptidoglycan/xylan/chitin deacetylase (PgdA/CDA1 family)